MVARVLFPLVLVAAALVSLGIVYPTVNGPFRVDCGQVDETTCDQVWREAAQHETGLDALLPVTRVRVTAAYAGEPADCLDVQIERWIFANLTVNDCP